MNSPNKQRGAAIIVALFVVALVAATAAMMIDRLHTDIRRTQLLLNADTSYLYAQGSVAWAMDQLNNDWKLQSPNKAIDHTPIQSPVEKINGFEIVTIISDAQGFFNVNNLTDPQYQTNFTRLIRLIAPDIDASKAQNITHAIIDWISPAAKNPALDEFYAKLNPAYRAPHRPMVSISELRLVRGMTPELFAKLSPMVFALPQPAEININNAPTQVLMSLSMTLSPDGAKSIETARKQTPFGSTQQFRDFDVVKNNPFDASKITVTSSYFLVQTNVTVGQQHLTLYTLLQRSVKDNKSNVIVLWQSQGTL